MIGMTFRAESVLAIDRGIKVQTRRAARLPKESVIRGGWEPTTFGGPGTFYGDGSLAPERVAIWNQTTGTTIASPLEVGDLVYVREAIVCTSAEPTAVYEADRAPCPLGRWPWPRLKLPAMFMPRQLARYILEIVEVRAQHLWDVTEADAQAEGAIPLQMDGLSYLPSFEGAWGMINGKRAPWESNPLVWAYTFRRVP